MLQIWAEVHEIMKAYGLSGPQQAKILNGWRTKQGGQYKGLLDSYMLQVTEEVVQAKDDVNAGGVDDKALLLDKTLDKTDSKGTGLWSVVEALSAAVPAPSLAAAVLSRQMSMCRDERLANAGSFNFPTPSPPKWDAELEEDLYWATAFAIIASYAQMFQSLRKLDTIFDFGLRLPETIATFRAGCILQGFLLGPMTEAFEKDPKLSNLLVAFEPELKENFKKFQRCVGRVTQQSNATTPVMYASCDYIKTMFATEIPSAQCVSLQRDVFGRHGFERLDKEGRFNATWKPMQEGLGECTESTSQVVKLSYK